jgi:succinate dehydrogenase/fumarate reductase flavoprotein subunit
MRNDVEKQLAVDVLVVESGIGGLSAAATAARAGALVAVVETAARGTHAATVN